MLDSFLDENPFCVGSDCYFSAISILRKATRIAMLSYTELSSFWSHDVFKEIYHITTEKTIQYKNIEQIVSDTLSIEKTLAHPTKKSLSEPSQKKNKEKHSIKRTAISQQMLSKIVKRQKKKDHREKEHQHMKSYSTMISTKPQQDHYYIEAEKTQYTKQEDNMCCDSNECFCSGNFNSNDPFYKYVPIFYCENIYSNYYINKVIQNNN